MFWKQTWQTMIMKDKRDEKQNVIYCFITFNKQTSQK